MMPQLICVGTTAGSAVLQANPVPHHIVGWWYLLHTMMGGGRESRSPASIFPLTSPDRQWVSSDLYSYIAGISPRRLSEGKGI